MDESRVLMLMLMRGCGRRGGWWSKGKARPSGTDGLAAKEYDGVGMVGWLGGWVVGCWGMLGCWDTGEQDATDRVPALIYLPGPSGKCGLPLAASG